MGLKFPKKERILGKPALEFLAHKSFYIPLYVSALLLQTTQLRERREGGERERPGERGERGEREEREGERREREEREGERAKCVDFLLWDLLPFPLSSRDSVMLQCGTTRDMWFQMYCNASKRTSKKLKKNFTRTYLLRF